MGSPRIDLSKFTKAPPKVHEAPGIPEVDLRQFAAAGIRGLSGFSPGGWPGAVIGGVGEGLAQTIEDRESYNYPQMGAQAALGAIPFGKSGKTVYNMAKGALLGGAGNLITGQAEEGLHIPEASELGNAAISATIGGLAGAIKLPAKFFGKSKAPEAEVKLQPVKAEIKSEIPQVEIPTLYHGTRNVVGEFDPKENQPQGLFRNRTRFTENPEYSELYSLGETPAGQKRVFLKPNQNLPNTIAAKVGTKNILDLTKPVTGNDLARLQKIFPELKGAPSNEFIMSELSKTHKDIPFDAIKFEEHGQSNWAVREGVDIKTPWGTPLASKPNLPKPAPLEGVPVEPNQPFRKLDLRKRPQNPMIMSDDPDAGRKIMEQILAESKASKIPEVSLQTPKTKQASLDPTAPARQSNIISWLNASKATAASADLSAPLRQGIFLVGRKAWWTAWKPMIQSLKEGNYDRINNQIASHPRFKTATADGLQITTPDSINKAEEHFASKIAENIPLVGKYLVKPSERAYTTFLNKLRIDLYNDLMDKAVRLKAPVDGKKLAAYINSATGRGSMGLTVGGSSKTLEAAAPLLNTVFFSPRFIASRMQLLNPVSYAKMDPFTRKEALRDLATLTSVAGTALGLAKASGAEVSMDPTDPDFGKIKKGNVRVDMLGGFGQYIRFFAQTVKGLTTEETGPDPKRFIESKLSPTAVMVKEMISGKDYFGKETSIPKTVINSVAPMLARDVYELWKEDPDLVPLAGLSGLGLPVQSYGEKKKNTKGTPSGIPRIRLPRY
jgi:hypothetical protein